MKNVSYIYIGILATILIAVFSCRSDYNPKPRGFFRIDLPEKEYQTFDTTYPYSFNYPVYGELIPHEEQKAKNGEIFWSDLKFPVFDATIHITYRSIKSEDDALRYIDDAHNFTIKQIPKATAINEKVINYPKRSVYGMLYHIEGTKAASTLQFFVTDSIENFLRGSLYFNVPPNNDSLAPVISFLKEDVEYLIETFKWQ